MHLKPSCWPCKKSCIVWELLAVHCSEAIYSPSFSQFKETAGTLFRNLKWSLKCYNNAAAPAMYVSCKYLYGQKIRLIRGDPPTHFHTGTPPSHTLTHKHIPSCICSLSHTQPSHIRTHTPSHICIYSDTPQPPTTKSLPRTPLSLLRYP